MLFCGPCSTKNGWPKSYHQSFGPCEVCRRKRYCSDVPTKFLPVPVVKSSTRAKERDGE